MHAPRASPEAPGCAGSLGTQGVLDEPHLTLLLQQAGTLGLQRLLHKAELLGCEDRAEFDPCGRIGASQALKFTGERVRHDPHERYRYPPDR